MDVEQLKEFLMPSSTKLYIFALLFFFIAVWLKAFGVKFYYFIISIILVYLYACDVVVKIEQGKIKDEFSLLKDIAKKFVALAMLIVLMMFLMKKYI